MLKADLHADPVRTVSPDDLARLKAEREDADRRYNEALTVLDASLRPDRDLPHPPPPPDVGQVTALNQRWNILAEGPALAGGWRGRLGGFVWRLVAPFLERQAAFNAALVEHVNRTVPVDEETQRAIASTIAVLGDELARLSRFQSSVIGYLQQVTPYVDTKDYEYAALARRLHEDNRELTDLLDHRTVGLGGAISGVGDELAKRWESMVARETRYDARATSLTAAHDELRSTLAIVQQASNTLKRELERLRAPAAVVPPGLSVSPSAPLAATTSGPAAAAVPIPTGLDQAQATTIDSYQLRRLRGPLPWQPGRHPGPPGRVPAVFRGRERRPRPRMRTRGVPRSAHASAASRAAGST